MNQKPEPLLTGLAFPEGPRWHGNRLYFSDMHSQEVVAVDLSGRRESIARIEGDPSGLGWLPDGRMLVVSMRDRRLLRIESNGDQTEVADLSRLATFHCNDMLVDEAGRAYVGNFGYDLHGGGTPAHADLIRVDPDGTTQVAAKDLNFPNGAVLTGDGRTLIIAETMAARLTAFEVNPDDGSLSERREWATLQGVVPDGICLDAEGAIWAASPIGHTVCRVREGGEITHRVPIESEAFACMLGGPERKHLFICTAGGSAPEEQARARDGKIEVIEVDVPGAGLP